MKKIMLIGIIVIGVVIAMALLGMKLFEFKDINEEKSFSLKGVSEIQVTMLTEYVHVIRTNAGDEVKFHLHGKSMTEIRLAWEEKQGALAVSEEREYKKPVPEELYLDIYIPEDYGKNLSVNIASGAFKMDAFQLKNFTLKDFSGKMQMEEINADSISIEALSGKLEIKKVNANELAIKNKSGAINLGGCIVKNGKIENKSGKTTLAGSSGNFDLRGASGEIQIACKELNNQNISIINSSGSITLTFPDTTEFSLEARTKSGKIKSDFAVELSGIAEKNKLVGQVGTQGNKVFLQTESGSISILKK